MSRRSGIESANIVDGPRKRLRGNNDAPADDVSSPAAAPSTSSAAMGAIERRIHSLSVDQVAQSGQRLMDTVMQAIDPSDGEPLHEFFLELPDAQEYPDYYEIIKRPMALDEIQSKLDQRSYPSLPDVKHDFETICNNAKRYNLRDTPVWLKARDLHSLIKISYVQIVETLPEPSAAPASTDPSTAAAGAEATPSRPKRILLRASKSQAKLNDEAQPKSEAQDHPLPTMSSTSSQKHEAEQQQPNVPVTPRQQSQQPYTAAGTPSSAADDDDDDDDDDDRWDNDGGSSKLTKGGLLDGRKRPGKRGKRLKATLRQLVYDLRRVIGTRGYPLVSHFDALPDRSTNPQYYQIISRPVCLRDIEHRVFEKGYINAHALFTDLELMLNNAMTFYPPDSDVWQDAAEIRQYFEREAIPALIQDGFTLEKDDVRQSALPLHLAANSTIEAHKLAYKMIVSRAAGGHGASQSPEPASRAARLGSAGVASSPALSATPGLPAASPGAFGSPSPAVASATGPAAAMPGSNLAMNPGAPAAMPMSISMPMPMPMAMSTPTSMSPIAAIPGTPGVPGMGMIGSPGRPMQFPGTTMTPTASPRPIGTPEGRRPVGRPPGKGTPSRSNPYPFLERRVGPGRPKKHEAAARQAAIAAHEEMLRKQALLQQQEDLTQQQQAAAFAAQPLPQWQQQQLLQQQQHMLLQQQRQQEQAQQRQQQQQQRRQQQQQQQQLQQQQQQQAQQQQAYLDHQRQLQQHAQHPHGLSPSPAHQMLPPITPGSVVGAHSPFGNGMAIGEPPSPVKRKEAVLPAEPREPPAFEGLEDRIPLISNFAIGMEVEEPDGQTLAVPPLQIKNRFATQHTLQIPPNASSITIEFPLRILNKTSRSNKLEQAVDPSLGDGNVSKADAPVNGDATAGEDETAEKAADPAKVKNGTNGAAEGESLTWPWQPEMFFNGKHTTASWTAADALIDPDVLHDDDDDEGEFVTSVGYSYCKVRVLPKRGINVFEITVKPDASYPAISEIPAERYSIFFC